MRYSRDIIQIKHITHSQTIQLKQNLILQIFCSTTYSKATDAQMGRGLQNKQCLKALTIHNTSNFKEDIRMLQLDKTDLNKFAFALALAESSISSIPS